VGQGKPKAVTKFGYTDVTLTFMKVAAITVITEELARFSVPNAETLVRDQLAEVVIARMDSDFIDPAISETSNVRPASITNGLTAQTSAGTSAANVLTDIQNLIEPFILAKVPIMNVVLIMPETLAHVLSLMQNSLGQREFPEMSVSGGRLRGFPVITSQYAANESSYGNLVIAVNARDIALADDGQVTVDASREASIQMDDTPTNDASTGTGQSLVSMFQTNSIALRAERVVTWKKLRDNAVVYMDDVNWGSIGSPV
jgi:HK97 family phage major capsid protein